MSEGRGDPMFFILSKTAALLLVPTNFLVAFGMLGLVLMVTRFARAGRRLLIASFVLLAIGGLSPAGRYLLHALESRFPPWDASRGAPDGIVVLGGSISKGISLDYGESSVGGEAGRLIALAKLARAYPDARIVFSGGDPSLSGAPHPDTEFLGPLLDTFGIPRTRVALEERSRNTAENAIFSKELVQPKPGERWLLVTSAAHMPRAVGCFRQVGFAVEAYPTDWHTRRRIRFALSDRVSNGLAVFDAAVHEWTGLVSYRLTGRTDALLPGPSGGH